MKVKRLTPAAAATALLAIALTGAGGNTATLAAPAHVPASIPAGFADDAFKSTWTRTDALVDNGTIKRSYYWGPLPGFSLQEDYAQGPGGKHLVQYFDKSRMEVNN